MQKLMGDEGWGGGPCFSLLTPSVCGYARVICIRSVLIPQDTPRRPNIHY